MIGKFLKSIQRMLVQSGRVHLRQNPTESTRDLVALIDRFLDGPMQHDLEWDDFISSENTNAHVEERAEIASSISTAFIQIQP